jgi:two-component system cell cycle sensor histidine kinase/response regulator CckA
LQATGEARASTPLTRPLRYGAAVVLPLIATALKVHFSTVIVPTYILAYPAVMLVATLGGLGPGIVATGASALLAWYWVIAPSGQFNALDLPEATSLAVFIAMGVFMSVVAEGYRRSRARVGLLERDNAIRAADAKFRTYVEGAPQALLVLDGHGRFVDCNPAAIEMLGVEASTLKKLAFGDLQEETDRPAAVAGLATLVATGRLDGDYKLVTPDGRLIWVTLRGVRLADDRFLAFCLDITERKRTEAALRETQSILQAAMDQSQAGIAIADAPTGKLRYVNDAGLLIRGEPRETVVNGVGIDQYIANWQILDLDGTPLPADDVPLTRAIMYGEVNSREFIIRRSPTDDRVVLAKAAPIRDAQGKITSAVVVFLDITERRQAEEALRSSEQRFRRAIQEAPFPLLIHAEDGEVIAVNRTWTELTGYTHADIPTIAAWTHKAYGPNQQAVIDDISVLYGLESRKAEGEYVIRCSDGTQRTWDFSSIGLGRLPDSRRIALSMAADVTQRKQAETQHQRLSMALEQAAEAVVITDAQGAIEYVNPAFEAVAGYTLAEVVGQNPRILKSGVQGDEFYRSLWETINGGRTWRGRLVNKRKDGKLFTEEATISPVRNAEGLVTSYVAVKRDITSHLALEAQLLQSQKMEGIGRLAGGIAHDFNNVLSVILSSAEFALEGLREVDPIRQDVQQIHKAGERAASLTRQLLAFSRKQVLQPVPLDLNQVLGEMEPMLRRIIGEDIDLVRVLPSDLGLAKADHGQIEQVILNLAINARDAMPNGGKLTLETRNVELDSEYAERHLGAASGPHVMIAVTDSGIGMDERTMERVFEPFFTTKGPGKGSGLGLSTVYGIVKQSGGSIFVYSELGHGTTFKVYLPRDSSLSTPVAKPIPATTQVLGSEIVLLAEDDEAVRNVAKRILVGAGFTVLTAAGGPEALLLCEQHPAEIHLLLTDVVMPGMSGRALAERLTALRPGIRVLFMSGYTDNAIVHQGVLDPGTQFISKPITQGELLRKVRYVLDGDGTGS